MPEDVLNQPIAALARPITMLDRASSVGAAARMMREQGVSLLAVVDSGRFFGAITESSLSRALADGIEMLEAVDRILDPAESTVLAYLSGAEGLRRFNELDRDSLVVIDDEARVLGLLQPSDLAPRRVPPPRPAAVGGMATPFGVYLTTGVVRGGASDLALITTGIAMFTILLVANVLGVGLAAWGETHGLSSRMSEIVSSAVTFIVFLGSFRLLPLSGTHAAEHQVVHAIERGEELKPEIVRRMPRVHPRCGTNLAVAVSMFLGIVTSTVIPSLELRALLALAATVLFWRPFGALIQQFVTTKPANRKQLENGIRAGEELLKNHVRARNARPSIPRRLLASGIFHVMAGSLLAAGAAWAIGRLVNVPIDVF